MNIAVLFPQDSPVASWNMGRGIVATLGRMGFGTSAIPLPTVREASQEEIDRVKRHTFPLEELKQQDGVLVSGPEHVGPWIDACYGRQEWKNLGVPRAAWLHESCRREDYTIDFDAISWMADEWFFPAVQDADFHDQEMFAQGKSHWLPFGVDTTLFTPAEPAGNKTFGVGRRIDRLVPYEVERTRTFGFDVAFMGLMYPKRAIYLRALGHHDHPPIRIGSVNITDLYGYDYGASARRYVSNLRSIKVFLNLPSLTRTLVAKVFEVLACGGFLLTPMLDSGSGANRNMTLFNSAEHLIYYRPSNVPYLAQLLRDWITEEKDQERSEIAGAGCREVHLKHSLQVRLGEILKVIGLTSDVHAPAG